MDESNPNSNLFAGRRGGRARDLSMEQTGQATTQVDHDGYCKAVSDIGET